jgi:hypothetical protein
MNSVKMPVFSNLRYNFTTPDFILHNDRGSRVRLPEGARNFPLHHRVPNGSGAHPASYSMGARGSFPGGKAARA